MVPADPVFILSDADGEREPPSVEVILRQPNGVKTMKTTTKVIFSSALMLSVVAPTLANAAYFEDQTKTWATDTRAQDVTDKVRVRKEGEAQTQVSREGIREFYGTGNTSVPGVGVDKDDTTPKSE
jgi:hypothetical protein